MPRLSDLQLILLAAANQRQDGNILPIPASVSGQGGRLNKSLGGLLKRSLVTEVEPAAADQVWREEGEQGFGLVITDAGRSALHSGAASSPAPTAKPAKAASARAPNKQDQVIELLRRQQGAILNELTEATGWLPHTIRAALTGLRKKGMKIEKTKRDDVTCYRIEASA
jgi:hypothetical protein